jgi:NDP-sugar pyrophosphorylase family protein
MMPKQAIILSAGLGTRMGELSRYLPKPLLPLVGETLLYYQVKFLNSLGIDDIYLNSHFQHEKMLEYIELKNLDVKVVHEEVLLGSGGVFHNLFRQGLKDEIFAVNADCFLFCDWKQALSKQRAGHVLFTQEVEPTAPYNRLVVTSSGRLKEVVPPSITAPPITFSGYSVINLSSLRDSTGPSGFFESVCNPLSDVVHVDNPPAPHEFWDFGTIDSYFGELKRIENNKAGWPLSNDKTKKTTRLGEKNIEIDLYDGRVVAIDLKELKVSLL